MAAMHIFMNDTPRREYVPKKMRQSPLSIYSDKKVMDNFRVTRAEILGICNATAYDSVPATPYHVFLAGFTPGAQLFPLSVV